MSIKPWLTSDDLISAVKRKFSIPIAQNLLTEDDILAFANEEMMISQVPSILQFHEEFFVFNEDITLENNKVKYPIPTRAIGGRLRDVFYKDTNGNLFDMTRINPNDKAYFQRDAGTNNFIQKYYIENNYIVLAPQNATNPTGFLNVSYFLRPNQLVKNERAAISSAFSKQLTIDNTTLAANDTFTIGDVTFTAVAGAPSALQFQIGASSTASATNLVSAINTDGTYSANNGTPSSANIVVEFDVLDTDFETSNTAAFVISTNQGIKFTEIPANITNGSVIDFLQTNPGHKLYDMSVELGSSAITGDYIYFTSGIIPDEFTVGDYVCLEHECIIPQIPTDLHTALAERTGNRIMAAIGDQIGLDSSSKKLQEMEARQGTLIDNRVEGSNEKVTARKGLLAWGRMGIRRRL